MRHSERMIAEAEARGDTAAAAYWQRIARVVDQAPPLTASQKDRLRILLQPAPVEAPLPMRRKTFAQSPKTRTAPATGAAA